MQHRLPWYHRYFALLLWSPWKITSRSCRCLIHVMSHVMSYCLGNLQLLIALVYSLVYKNKIKNAERVNLMNPLKVSSKCCSTAWTFIVTSVPILKNGWLSWLCVRLAHRKPGLVSWGAQ